MKDNRNDFKCLICKKNGEVIEESGKKYIYFKEHGFVFIGKDE